MTHDPLCVTPYKQQSTCASCVLVARVRVDEHRKSANANAVMGYMRGAVDEALADLRAKVSALDSDPGWAHGARLVSRADVLALIDEAAQS